MAVYRTHIYFHSRNSLFS